MRRIAAGVIGALLVTGLIAPAVSAAPPTTGVPKVVVIVGPAGAATARYRTEARSAAAAARRYTQDVTEIYSPNATWPAVKAALKGASLVLYMGHGNGWPSPYRDELYPASQNGFGLNPSADGDDYTHQYFGESRIAESIRLAPDAVVLLNHLCYASGNSEPGLPEGTLGMAKQRVDNFAAGFIKAGAAAVVAEAYASPNNMVRAVLGGHGRIESAWRNASSSNGHAFGFDSVRSPGYVAEMDPERSSSGFSRSIVLKRGLASSDVRRNGRGSVREPVRADPASLVPSLAARGVSLSAPRIQGGTAAAERFVYRIPFKATDRDRLPESVQASVRWDPLDPVTADLPDPGAGATTGNSGPVATTGEAGTSTAEETPPSFDLITPERLGDVVAPRKIAISKSKMSFSVKTPATPGRYRLTVMLHDSEGVAYDPATQAMLKPLIIRVTGDHDAGVIAPQQVTVAPGNAQKLSVWVGNLGRSAWGRKATSTARSRDPDLRHTGMDQATHARLSGTWLSLNAPDDPTQLSAAAAASVTPFVLPAAMAPGSVAKAELIVYAPSAPGEYLLILDILTPEVGSLAALGVDPTIIRVHVEATTSAAGQGFSGTVAP